jgi:2-dehydropantoate 2-reductase
MEYLVIGAGGTGGCIGGYLAAAGKDVTLIARGRHLEVMQKTGLRIETTTQEPDRTIPVCASDMEHYEGRPDVIFVCVKGYSLEDTVPFIRRVAKSETVVIPILNIYGTGGRLQQQLPDLLVTDGCIYVAAEVKEPGCILKKGDIFRVVYGVRKSEEYRPVLEEIRADLADSGITPLLSDNIQRDALQKFSYVSPAAACGQYYHAMAGDMQHPGEVRDTFAALIHEIDLLAAAMGITFEVDIVRTNLEILDTLSPEASTSMQRDIMQGKQSEIDGLVFEVLRMANKFGVSLPNYEKIALNLKKTLDNCV